MNPTFLCQKTLRLVLVGSCGLLVWPALTHPSRADVTLHNLFTDHMVLQRDRPLPIWGKATPGEKVTVAFGAQTKTTAGGTDGRWMVELAPLGVSNTPGQITVRGNNIVTVNDVLVGDVWLGSGQSNMDYTVSGTDGANRVRATPPGQFTGIRLFKVPDVEADQPTDSVNSQWQEPTTGNVLGFSATLFYFGEELHQRMPGVPLGLVRSSLGATNSYSWFPNEVRDLDPSTAYLRQWWANASKTWTPEKQAAADKAMTDYLAQVAAFKDRGERLPDTVKKPGEVIGPKWSRRPSALYNGMIAPLQPFSLRGVIWYQGEWDSKHDWVRVYHDSFLALAQSWRANWAKAGNNPKLGDFPVYLVQLPSRIPGDGDFWPYMREAEAKIASDLPNSGFVTTYDLNDGTDLHPKEKTEIGRRLARLALAREYKQNVAYHGPWVQTATVAGPQITVTFDVGADAMQSSDGEPLRNFEIAGADGKYVPAHAEIRGSTVVVASPDVPQPLTVRYAWSPTPLHPNFFNSEGLPANPFRTDTQQIPEK